MQPPPSDAESTIVTTTGGEPQGDQPQHRPRGRPVGSKSTRHSKATTRIKDAPFEKPSVPEWFFEQGVFLSEDLVSAESKVVLYDDLSNTLQVEELDKVEEISEILMSAGKSESHVDVAMKSAQDNDSIKDGEKVVTDTVQEVKIEKPKEPMVPKSNGIVVETLDSPKATTQEQAKVEEVEEVKAENAQEATSDRPEESKAERPKGTVSNHLTEARSSSSVFQEQTGKLIETDVDKVDNKEAPTKTKETEKAEGKEATASSEPQDTAKNSDPSSKTDEPEKYRLHQSVWNELLVHVYGGLMLPKASFVNSLAATKSHTILHYPKNGGLYFLDAVAEKVAAEVGATLIRIDAQDLEEIAGDFLGDTKQG